MTANKRAKSEAHARKQRAGEPYMVARRRSTDEKGADARARSGRFSAVAVQIGDEVWIRKPGATSTPDEFVAAMNQIRVWTETRPPHELVLWNPWDYEELEKSHAFDAATWTARKIRDGWRKKGDRRKRFDVDAWMAKGRARFERSSRPRRRAGRRQRKTTTPTSTGARLALLEDQMAVRRVDEALGEFRDGTGFPKMDPAQRGQEDPRPRETPERTPRTDNGSGRQGRRPRDRYSCATFAT